MPLDDADLEKIKELVTATVQPLTQSLADQTIRIVEERLKPVTKQVSEVADKLQEVEQAADKVKGKTEASAEAGESGSGKVSPEVARLQAQLEELQRQNQTMEQQRREAEERAKIERLHAAARDGLLQAGVPAARVPLALAVLKDEGVLTYADDGTPGFKFQRKGYSEVVPATDGAAEWLKSDAGKLFLPPVETSGTGERGNGRRPPPMKGGEIDWSVLKERAAQALSTIDLIDG